MNTQRLGEIYNKTQKLKKQTNTQINKTNAAFQQASVYEQENLALKLNNLRSSAHTLTCFFSVLGHAKNAEEKLASSILNSFLARTAKSNMHYPYIENSVTWILETA